MAKYLGAIDQGTSSTRFIIFTLAGRPVVTEQCEHAQIYPRAGLVEHDVEEVWRNVQSLVGRAMARARLAPTDLAGIGITNQRETTVVWNKDTGAAYHNAIVWSDSRTADACERLRQTNPAAIDLVRTRAGLPVAPYFSGGKLKYLLDTVPGLREDAEKGVALFGTIDTYLIWKLTGGRQHCTDVTNASRTMLMSLGDLAWDDDLLGIFGVPRAMLPCIQPSVSLFGEVAAIEAVRGCKITGVLGDQQAALFGQACFSQGEAKATYGTGCFLLMNTGSIIVPSKCGLLTTVAYQCEGGAPVYALEGSVAYSGAVMQWLRDNMGVIQSVSDSEAVATSVPDNGGVYFVPAFSGLYAPYWRSDARGLIVGLTAFNTRAHLVRAALEASTFQAREVIDAMERDFGLPIPRLNVDGGMTANSFLMQFQSDILDIPVVRPAVSETTALGAALAAGLGAGLWPGGVQELRGVWAADKQWFPKMDKESREALLVHWFKAVSRTLDWLTPSDLHAAAAPLRATTQSSATESAVNDADVQLQQEDEEGTGERGEDGQSPLLWSAVGAVLAAALMLLRNRK